MVGWSRDMENVPNATINATQTPNTHRLSISFDETLEVYLTLHGPLWDVIASPCYNVILPRIWCLLFPWIFLDFHSYVYIL